jgi:MFS family permease
MSTASTKPSENEPLLLSKLSTKSNTISNKKTGASLLKAWSTLIASTLFMMFPGSIYIQGAITPYIASYYNVPIPSVANMLPVFFLLGAVILPIGGWMISIGLAPRLILIIGASIHLICFFSTIIFDVSFNVFFALYITAYGMLQGITYMIPIKQSWLHFPNNPGLVSGVIIGGYGFSAFILNNVITELINPNNLAVIDGKFPQEVDDRFQMMMLFLGCFYVFLSLVGIIFIFPGPVPEVPVLAEAEVPLLDQSNMDDDNVVVDDLTCDSETSSIGFPATPVKSQSERASPKMKTKDGEAGTDLYSLLLSRPCVLLYIMNFCSIFLGLYVVNSYKAYGNINGLNDDKYLSFVGSMAAIMNSCRFVWSGLLDKFTYKTVYGALLAIQIGIGLTMEMVKNNEVLYCVWVAMSLFTEGAHFSLVPNVLKMIFGDKLAIQMYSVVFSYTAVSAFLQLALQVMFLRGHPEVFGYLFYLGGGLSVIALLMLVLMFKEGKHASAKLA